MRLLVLAMISLLLVACSPKPPQDASGSVPPELWAGFKQAFIDASGRVVDTGNNNISHSEGQGYAMLLAVAANDRHTFDSLWTWTQQNLPRSDKGLFAWRWRPDTDPHADDPNNASDGEVLMAWALARAAARWNVPAYREQAVRLAQAVRHSLLRPTPYGQVLIPGAFGFEHADRLTLNLSYWVFPAFVELKRIDPAPEWDALTASGIKLINGARFGELKLPPDWLQLDKGGALRPADGWPPRFGFDAIRIPFHACWAGLDTPELYAQANALWSQPTHPAWLDLESGEVAPYALSSGGRLIWQFMQHCISPAPQPLPLPQLEGEDYYSSVLGLLVVLAYSERAR